MIEVKNLYKSFGKKEVLKGVDLEFSKPGITAILGPNSSGKTTLIKSILGMVIPNSGDILFDGQGIKREWLYRERIGYLPQIARFPDNLKVKELFRMIKEMRNAEAKDQALIERFELDSFMQSRLGNLSGGTRQKINIVLALMYDAPVLILDEPTAGLDPASMIKLKELVLEEKEKGKHILITTHVMSFVEEMADDLVFLYEGKIVFKGRPVELIKRTNESNLERAIAEVFAHGLARTTTLNGFESQPTSTPVKTN